MHRGALREWFVEFMTDLGYPPTVEDWYRFVQGVEERSLVKIRAIEHDDFLFNEALRQAAADTGMTLITLGLDKRES